MLINLYAYLTNNKLEFELPSVYFKEGQHVCVTEICGILDPKREDKDSSLIRFTSSLIDKSPQNLNQELLFIHQSKHKNFFHVTPTQLSYYKIQCLDLKSSQFNLFDIAKDQNLENLIFVYLQLKVIDGFQ